MIPKKTVTIKEKQFDVFLGQDQIKERNVQLGEKISRDFAGEELLVLGVLNGSFIYMADLCREIDLPLVTSFIRISSYAGTESTGNVKSILGLTENLNGKNVLIIEDIVDTGHSMKYLLDTISGHNPARVAIATLLHKPDAFQYNYALDYVGFEIPNKFVLGYGLDYDGFGRNLPDIYQLSPIH
ncbi:hypoxanthine phosphoribosyltransferase [Algoriphagus halophytocola]|uniref:Hypoxanthine phosphoribosyltransferase n=1 Tax=Algoriphagus halophytocola TaxID=2991499 RepID=A0ABY6MDJ5_9BACT|nr:MULTISPECIES: hypoxanthine phosphoribosyltransferase [unclassified Algoriphagus]UZD20950.1 hypoxanthine phosphoribosyltransferase [Algoriphagus sp. TR-M5]WBL42116.1 hypoxanthine phosphoribosyltransferase [Algoriphagus sp. TR-M9]